MHLPPLTSVPAMKMPLLQLMHRIRGLVACQLGAAAALPLIQWSRAPARDKDRVLLSETHLWLRQIPSSLLPKHMCRHHPHLANRFADCWGVEDRVQALTDELSVDRRGGRKGFSARVRGEIEQLKLLHARWLDDPAATRRSLVARRRTVRRHGSLQAEGRGRAGSLPGPVERL